MSGKLASIIVFCSLVMAIVVTTIIAINFINEREPVTCSTGVEVPRHSFRIYEQGAHARRNGVPANANPYAVAHCSSEAATWLNGWIDVKE